MPFCGQRCSFCSGSLIVQARAAYPLTITTKNGESKRIDFNATMMRGDDGKFIGADSKMQSVYQQIVDVAQYDFQDDKIVAVLPKSDLGKVSSIEALNKEFKGITDVIEIRFSNYKGPGEMQSP